MKCHHCIHWCREFDLVYSDLGHDVHELTAAYCGIKDECGMRADRDGCADFVPKPRWWGPRA